MKCDPRTLLPLLATANLVCGSSRSPEELRALADIFAEDLASEELDDVCAAFALHRRRSRFFPTPADIIAILPETRRPRKAAPAIEQRRTPGYGKKICEAYRLKRKAELDALVKNCLKLSEEGKRK